MGKLCIAWAFALFSLTASAQTAPNGQLSPGFQSCDPPQRLSSFYDIDNGHWKIVRVHMNGRFMVMVGQYIGPKQNPTDPDIFPVWVQDLGNDGILTSSDFDIGVSTHYIMTLPQPTLVSISKSGLLAFTMSDPTTAGRTYDDPLWVASPQNPTQTTVSVPMDEVVMTCFFASCSSTVKLVKRFMPIYHLTYSSATATYMQLDGSITGLHWESVPGGGFGSEYLMYSYVQYQNSLLQFPPWEKTAPSPVPSPRLPETGINKFDPWSGTEIPVARHVTQGGQDGTSFVLSGSAQTNPLAMVWPKYLAFLSHGSLALNGGVAWMDAFELAEDPGFGTTSVMWGQQNPIATWEDGPSSYLWAGRWKSTTERSTLGYAESLANGLETVAVRTTLETLPSSTHQRDVVFRSSINGFVGPDQYVTPVNDNREVTRVAAMDTQIPTLTVAVETQPLNNNNQKRTQIYRYQPSNTPGQIGSFAPYKEVLVSAPNQVLYLHGATSEYVWGTHDDYSLSPARVRDFAVVRCP